MKKKLLAVFASLCLVFSMMPATALAVGSSSGAVPAPGEVSTWAELQSAIDSRSDATLVADITCPEGGVGLTVSKAFTLDLNGYTLDRGLSGKSAVENGYVIKSSGELTIKDSSPRQTGKITGGNNTGNGGGVYVESGKLILQSGVSVCGNSAQSGGGVFNGGVLELSGSVVCHNSAQYGGGVCCSKSSDLFVGGIISNNTAASDGGGIYAGNTVNVYNDAVIKGNVASGNGGGICMNCGLLYSSALLRLQPGEGASVDISENKAAAGGGVYVSEIIGVDSGTRCFFRVQGKITIEGNTDLTGSVASNTYLTSGVRMYKSGSGLAEDANIHITSADSVFFCDYDGNSIDVPAQIVRDGSSSAAVNPFPVVYFGTGVTSGSGPIAWYLLPATNYSNGNAWFLWSKDSVGEQKFASVDQSAVNDLDVPELGSEVDIFNSIVSVLGSSDTTMHTWWNSTARVWLNDAFYKAAFSTEEKAAVLKTNLSRGNTIQQYEGVGVSDYVFLLSAEELISSRYGFADNLTGNIDANDYVANPDVAKASSSSYLMRTPWCAGPGFSDAVPGVVGSTGIFGYNGAGETIESELPLRPGVNLDKNEVLFFLPAINVDSGKIDDQLTAVSNPGREYKAAIKDSDTFAVSNQRINGNEITFTYSGVATGEGRYITAVLLSSAGTVKYMSNLAEASAAGDTLTVDLTDVKVETGDKLYVCSNLEEGDKKASFVSNLAELNLPEIHNLVAVSKASSCTAIGISQNCWYCSDCGKYFSDDKGAVELAASEVEVEPSGHAWTTDYSEEYSDYNMHYKYCAKCGAMAEGVNHSYSSGEACEDCGRVRSYWITLQYELANAENGATITMTQDAVCEDADWGTIAFPKASSNKNVTLNLNGHTIDANQKVDYALWIKQAGLTVTDASATNPGKITGAKSHGVYAGNACSLNNVTIERNGGNGVYSDYKETTISNCTIADNGGTGVYVADTKDGSLSIANSTISGNGSDGVYTCVETDISGCTVSNNAENGAHAYYATALQIKDGSVISGNKCGVYAKGDTVVSISGQTEVTANSGAGGIYVSAGSLSIEGSTIEDNSSASDGGGVYADRTWSVNIKDCAIKDNVSSGKGGGVCVAGNNYYSAKLTMERSTVSGNASSDKGGGIYFGGVSNATCSISDTEIIGNHATKADGIGGICVSSTPTGFTLGGVVKVSGNYAGITKNKSDVQMEGGGSSVTIAETLSSGSSVGFRSNDYTAGTLLVNCESATAATANLGMLFSDQPCYAMKVSGDTIVWNGVSQVGHNWQAATCTEPKTCTECGTTEGKASGHSWSIDYESNDQGHYRTCTVEGCGVKEDVEGHSSDIDAPTPTTPQTCKTCGFVMAEATGFAVTFDMQGHGAEIAQQGVANGGNVAQPPAPTATGYVFGGWFKEAACINAWDFETDTVTEATTLYAKWTKKFNVSDIVVSGYNGTYDGKAHGITVTLSGDAENAKLEYRTSESESYSDNNPTFTTVGSYTVYYKVSKHDYMDEFGSATVSISKADGDLVAPVPAEGLVYDGVAQKLAIAGSSDTGSLWYRLGEGEWSKDVPTAVNAGTYTVSYMLEGDGNHGDVAEQSFEVMIAKAQGKIDAAPTPKIGLIANGEEQELVSAGSSSTGTMMYKLEGEAEWRAVIPEAKEIGSYTVLYMLEGDENHTDAEGGSVEVAISGLSVSFDLQGRGSEIEGQTIAFGDKIAKPADPAADGFVFDGWYKEAACVNAWDFENDTVSADIALYAKWTQVVGSVSVSVSGLPANGDKVSSVRVSADNATASFEWESAPEAFVGGETYEAIITLTAEEGCKFASGASVSVDAGSCSEPSVSDKQITISFTYTVPLAEFGASDIVASGYTGKYDGKSHGITVSLSGDAEGATVEYRASENDSYSADTPTFTAVGSHMVYYKVSKLGYKEVSGHATVSISKADGSLVVPVPAEGLVYDGAAQVLATAGSSSTGALRYKLDNGEWSEDVPAAVNAGTYTVSYKLEGDSNHNDVAEQSFQVTIAKAQGKIDTAPMPKAGLIANGEEQELVDAGSSTPSTTILYKLGLEGDTWSSAIPTAKEIGTYKVCYKLEGSSNYEGAEGGVLEVSIAGLTATFDSNGGPAVDPQTVIKGACFTDTGLLKRAGYGFAGWYADKELTRKYDFSTPASEDITLYAKWTEYEVQVGVAGEIGGSDAGQGGSQGNGSDNARGGVWTMGSTQGLTFRCSGDFSLFKGLWLDGKEIDKSNYDAYEGSTVVVLKPGYLTELGVGKHELSFHYVDGAEIPASFEVVPAESAKAPVKDDVLAGTGDSTAWPAAVFGMVLAGAVVVLARRRIA